MKIEYEEINGLLYPKLALSPQKEIHLTRFGRKRLQYLKQYRPIIYTNLLTSDESMNIYKDRYEANGI
ncbi:TnpV protein [Coprobacillus cateniformis]|uniref:TnpV protein n=1 Tax=Coprobacillus cateniformis TaxID=100884 RepID=UPI0039A0B2F0